MSSRTFSDKHLQADPALAGAILASPARRAVALVLDLMIVILPSVAVAVCAAAISLSVTDPRALDGLRTMLRRQGAGEQERIEAFKSVLPLLARIEAPGLPGSTRALIEEGKLDEAYEALRDYDYLYSLQFSEDSHEPLKPKTIRIEVGEVIPRSVRFFSLYGVAMLYFGLFLSGRKGATPGKRMAGIRVARVDGHRLNLAESIERFVGYLHIPGTLGISILDLWRDPNRRLPHDRVVNTIVLRCPPKKAGR
jgi:hypothetical protein